MARNQNFRDFMSPDFQASQPMMEWLPWEDGQQQGADLGSILGQLKPQGQSKDKPYSGGGMYNAGEGFGDQMVNPAKTGGGKSSL